MTNLIRSNFQAHPFHLVSPSPWPLFTSIALLTLTTTGILNMPGLNQAICWNILLLFVEIGQSAGNQLSLGFLGILRDYTLEFFYCIIPLIVVKPSIQYSDNLSHYLAGLIESDGTIIVPKSERSPKGRINYPSMQIIFNSRDLPLALLVQKELGEGSLSKKKGSNAYVLTFNSRKSILLIVSLINGKMRTPKINTLYDLIDWLNGTQDSNSSPAPRSSPFQSIVLEREKTIKKLPLNSGHLESDSWLAGFIEGDGHFGVRVTPPNGKRNYPIVECRFELKKKNSINSGYDYEPIMNILAKYLNVELSITKTKSYTTFTLRTINLKSNDILIKYLDSFPLFSSNYLNYKDWLKVLEIYRKYFVNDKSEDIVKQILTIKESMNDKRTIFN